MSLQVDLSNKSLSDAYHDVLNNRGINWVLYTYENGTNILKVQSKGNGGLDEMQGLFSDGRIQYAFARVIDPDSQVAKFVQINWCGEGVAEAKKGLFHTHSSAVGSLLRGAHFVVNARNENDVVITSRAEGASGVKYSVQKEVPRPFEPVTPVGTNYKPVGKVDIAALRATPPFEPITPVGTNYKPVGKVDIAALRATPPFEPVTPVGTNYKPVGKVDIAALRATPTPSTPTTVKPLVPPSVPRPLSNSVWPPTTTASLRGRASVSTGSVAPSGAWITGKPSFPSPPSTPAATSRISALPATARPIIGSSQSRGSGSSDPSSTPAAASLISALHTTARPITGSSQSRGGRSSDLSSTPAVTSLVPALPATSRPIIGLNQNRGGGSSDSSPSPIVKRPTPPFMSATVEIATKKDEEGKPIGSAYVPVSLPAPKKLKNPFAEFERQQQITESFKSSIGGGKQKGSALSERQASRVRQQVEEEHKFEEVLRSIDKKKAEKDDQGFSDVTKMIGAALVGMVIGATLL